MSTGADTLQVPAYDNAQALGREFTWFNQVVEKRFSIYFEQVQDSADIYSVTEPSLENDFSEYAKLVKELKLKFDERLILVLALLPRIKPQMLDLFLIRNKNLDRGYTEFGGRCDQSHGGFLPTLETAMFLLAGDNLEKRFELMHLFDEEHKFITHDVLRNSAVGAGEPHLNALLSPTSSTVSRLTTGITHKPDFGIEFPAKLTTTLLTWDDLVLAEEVKLEITHITAWLEHSSKILNDWDLRRNIKPGFRSLFHGPPGTGKTLTAALIGKKAQRDVYRIDMSMLVSKFIGETEKNLSNVFDQAQHQNWILFFDEADALFGKRTQTTTSNDRHANREISYLLQRVEDYPGVVILATNMQGNIDEAFARRFQSAIYFPMPDEQERLQLWQGIVGKKLKLEGVNLKSLAAQYELAGGSIINVVRYAAINAAKSNRESVNTADLKKGIRKEFRKEGRTAQ